MNGPSDYNIKWSKSDKDKYHITYMWNIKQKKIDTNMFIYKTEIDSQTYKTNLWLPKRKGGVGDKLGIWE